MTQLPSGTWRFLLTDRDGINRRLPHSGDIRTKFNSMCTVLGEIDPAVHLKAGTPDSVGGRPHRGLPFRRATRADLIRREALQTSMELHNGSQRRVSHTDRPAMTRHSWVGRRAILALHSSATTNTRTEERHACVLTWDDMILKTCASHWRQNSRMTEYKLGSMSA